MNKNTIGLAYRARKVCAGTEITIERMKTKKVYLVLLASDASAGTKKKITDKSRFYNVIVDDSLSTDELSSLVGKSNIKVLGILDKGFAESIKK